MTALEKSLHGDSEVHEIHGGQRNASLVVRKYIEDDLTHFKVAYVRRVWSIRQMPVVPAARLGREIRLDGDGKMKYPTEDSGPVLSFADAVIVVADIGASPEKLLRVPVPDHIVRIKAMCEASLASADEGILDERCFHCNASGDAAFSESFRTDRAVAHLVNSRRCKARCRIAASLARKFPSTLSQNGVRCSFCNSVASDAGIGVDGPGSG